MQRLDDGGYAIEDTMEIGGTGVDDFVFARGWLLEIVEIERGDYYFISDDQPVRPRGNCFGVFYPPFTFIRAGVSNVKAKVIGIGSATPYTDLPDHPFLFETDHVGRFTTTKRAFEVLRDSRSRRTIAVRTTPSPITARAKQLIDDNYLAFPSIARIASRLKISHEHLSRQFKKDFGISPSAYLHKLRVAEATFRLALGEDIIEISQDVGYNDLSRFYKQFRKSTRTSPAACRKQMSKNAKT